MESYESDYVLIVSDQTGNMRIDYAAGGNPPKFYQACDISPLFYCVENTVLWMLWQQEDMC